MTPHRPRYAIILTLIGAAMIGLGVGLIVYATTVHRNAERQNMECLTNSYSNSIESGQVEDLSLCPNPDSAGNGWKAIGAVTAVLGAVGIAISFGVANVLTCQQCRSEIDRDALICPHCLSPTTKEPACD